MKNIKIEYEYTSRKYVWLYLILGLLCLFLFIFGLTNSESYFNDLTGIVAGIIFLILGLYATTKAIYNYIRNKEIKAVIHLKKINSYKIIEY